MSNMDVLTILNCFNDQTYFLIVKLQPNPNPIQIYPDEGWVHFVLPLNKHNNHTHNNHYKNSLTSRVARTVHLGCNLICPLKYLCNKMR